MNMYFYFFFSFLKKINKKILQFVIKIFTRKKKPSNTHTYNKKGPKYPYSTWPVQRPFFFLPKCPKVAIARLHLKYVAQSWLPYFFNIVCSEPISTRQDLMCMKKGWVLPLQATGSFGCWWQWIERCVGNDYHSDLGGHEGYWSHLVLWPLELSKVAQTMHFVFPWKGWCYWCLEFSEQNPSPLPRLFFSKLMRACYLEGWFGVTNQVELEIASLETRSLSIASLLPLLCYISVF